MTTVRRTMQPWYLQGMPRAPRPLPTLLLFATCAAAAACPGTQATPQAPLVENRRGGLPPELEAADLAFRDYLRRTRLQSVPSDAQRHVDVLRSMIRWKSSEGQRAIAPFEVLLTREADPAIAETALIRLAVFHLNLGCEVAELATPVDFSEPRQAVFADVLDASAFKQLATATELLQEAASLHEVRSEELGRLLALMPGHDGEVDRACRLTRETWAPPSTPSVDELARAACEAGEPALCWVWAAWGNGGAPAWDAACDGDVGRACLAIADRKTVYGRTQSDSTEAAEAERLYARACLLGEVDGCRREYALVVPARGDDYRAACLDNQSALDCVKLYRTLPVHGGRDLWWACTSEAIAADAETCASGDPLGCAARAFAMVPELRHELAASPTAAPDPARAALACGEGDTAACLAGAAAYAPTSRTCAGLLLTEACARGQTDACGFLPPNRP